MKLAMTPEAENVMETLVLVTGAMRTGSTLLGRIFRSMREVEAFHEPGVVYSLFPLIDQIEPEQWKLLFSASVYEDCLIRSLNATSLNMNRADESWIGHSLDAAELERRMSCDLDHETLRRISLNKTVCVKVPEMTPYLQRYREIFPRSQVILTLRQPERVVSSLLRKGYFSDERLLRHPKKWPNRVFEGRMYPFWLPESIYSEWDGLSEFSRCCLSFSFQYDSYMPSARDVVVDYDAFCAAPQQYWGEIMDKFGWAAGPLTSELLSGVAERPLVADQPNSRQDREYLSRAMYSYERQKSSLQ